MNWLCMQAPWEVSSSGKEGTPTLVLQAQHAYRGVPATTCTRSCYSKRDLTNDANTRRNAMKLRALALTAAAALAFPAFAQQAAPRVLKMQSSWPAGIAAQDHFRMFGERL